MESLLKGVSVGRDHRMKKGLQGFVLLFLSAVVCAGQEMQPPVTLSPRASVSAAAVEHRSITVVTVPADTEAAIEMLSGLHTRVSHVDDPIEARLLKPVYVQGRVALPYGTLLEGHVTRVRPAGHLHRPAEMSFRFDSISLPDGQRAPISAVLTAMNGKKLGKTHLDNEGNLRGSRGFSFKRMVGGFAAAGTFATLRAAVAGVASLAYSLPAGGAAFLGYELLAPRGSEVHVPPETQFRIRLNNPVTVQVRG
jgi:hypothetical protein